MMKSISKNKRYAVAGAAIVALTAPQMVMAADAPAQAEEVVSVEMVNADGKKSFVHVDFVVERLQEGYKLTAAGYQSLSVADVDYFGEIVLGTHVAEVVDEDGEDTSKINTDRQNLIKQAISTGDWQPYYAFEYQNTPGFFEVTVETDEDGNEVNVYEYNKVYYGSLLESHLKNYNTNVANLAHEHGWENAHADEGEEPGWKDVLDEGHNAYMTSYIEKFNEAPGIVPYVVHLNHTQALADEYGVEMVADGYFDSEFNSPDLLKGLIASGDTPITVPDVDEDKDGAENPDVNEDPKEGEDPKDGEDPEVGEDPEDPEDPKDPETDVISVLKEFKDLSFTVGDPAEKLDMKAYFSTPEGTHLSYSVDYGEPGTYDEENYFFDKDEKTLTITPKAAVLGEGNPITITATLVNAEGKPVDENGELVEFDENGDPKGEIITKASNTFNVKIAATPAEPGKSNVKDDENKVTTREEVMGGDKKLPQTGSESNSLFAGLGVMLIGLATALGLRKKKKSSK